MDDKNIDLLVKQRTEEIKRQRDHENDMDTETAKVEVKAEETCVTEETVNETVKTVKKAQRWNVVWKLLALGLLVGVNLLWMNNVRLSRQIDDLELEVLSLLEGGNSYTYKDIIMAPNDVVFVDNRTLINVDFVMENIDTNIHYSNSGTRVYIPLENISFELETKEVTDYVKKHIVDINIPILTRNDVNYIDFEVLKKLYNLDVIAALDGSFAIYEKNDENLVMVPAGTEFVKTSHGMKLVSEGDNSIKAIHLDTHEDLSKIITENGRIGYVLTENLEEPTLEFVDIMLNEVRMDADYGESIHVTWDQLSQFKDNMDLSVRETLPGVDVVSPTWFSLNINGIVISEADFRYVSDAHEKGYKVWGLFSNSFKPNWTSEMLNDEIYMKKTIAQIAFFTALYDLDGVNIDYENMYLEDQDKFTQFLAELSSILREQNVVLSVDVTVPGGSDNWSKVFDRLNIAKHVDYVMLMAYDEYWASSDVSGPVASIPWTELGIRETLELVPNDKLILGMPMYMRVWIESGGTVNSKSLGIKSLEGILEDQEVERSYDDENLINYISYRSDGKLHRIWVEDALSIEKRVTLMHKYDLPGIGTWSMEFVENDTYELIKNLIE